jgi:hypothetical protein
MRPATRMAKINKIQLDEKTGVVEYQRDTAKEAFL